jgi:hypothetical protein
MEPEICYDCGNKTLEFREPGEHSSTCAAISAGDLGHYCTTCDEPKMIGTATLDAEGMAQMAELRKNCPQLFNRKPPNPPLTPEQARARR